MIFIKILNSQSKFLLIPIFLILLIVSVFTFIKVKIFSHNEPKITIYQTITSPNNKYNAIYYNVDEGLLVKNYSQICIRDTSTNTTKNIEEFMPYYGRVISIDNDNAPISIEWNDDTTLVISYDSEKVKDIALKETYFKTNNLNKENELESIKIIYIDN